MKTNDQSFDVGEMVEWTSNSAGIDKTKRGRVEMIIPRGKRPTIKNCGSARDHVSYVVRADGRAYWPRVMHLRLVDGAALAKPGEPK